MNIIQSSLSFYQHLSRTSKDDDNDADDDEGDDDGDDLLWRWDKKGIVNECNRSSIGVVGNAGRSHDFQDVLEHEMMMLRPMTMMTMMMIMLKVMMMMMMMMMMTTKMIKIIVKLIGLAALGFDVEFNPKSPCFR